MVLNAQTKIGLTFGQVLSLITTVGIMVLGYANLDMRINAMELKGIETEKNILKNNVDIEVVRTENRQDHTSLSAKIDQLIMFQKNDKR